MTANPDPVAIPVVRVAAWLGVRKQRVYELIEDGWLHVLPGRGHKMVLVESVQQYIDAARQSGRQPQTAS